MRVLLWSSLALLAVTLVIVILAIGGSGGSCGGGSGPVGGVPANLVALYEGADATYQLGPQGAAVLAAINFVETGFGHNLSTSTAGAVGWMQFMPATWATYRVTPTGRPAPNGPAGWNDPADAIYTAAKYLRANGAPGNWQTAIYGYNHATWYVQEVVARAQAYYQQGVTGTPGGGPTFVSLGGPASATAGASCQAASGVGTVPGTQAQIDPTTGAALAPANAPPQVQAMIAAGDRIIHFDYQWGGGHANPALSDSQTNPQPQGGQLPGQNGTPGYDCSGATSYVLWGGGFGNSILGGSTLTSGQFESVGLPGPGKWVTWYANGGHVYIEVAGIYLDTAAGAGRPPNPPSTGPRWTPAGSGPAGFVARHPPGL
jgi:hypothetical protein